MEEDGSGGGVVDVGAAHLCLLQYLQHEILDPRDEEDDARASPRPSSASSSRYAQPWTSRTRSSRTSSSLTSQRKSKSSA